MNVTVAHAEEQRARAAAVQLFPLCDELQKVTTLDRCKLTVVYGVVVADLWAKDGAHAQVAMGVKPIAALLASKGSFAGLAAVLVRRATEQMTLSRRHSLLTGPVGI